MAKKKVKKKAKVKVKAKAKTKTKTATNVKAKAKAKAKAKTAARSKAGVRTKGKAKVDMNRPIILPANYTPSDKEEFMNPLQIEYFKQKLLQWRSELLDEANDTLSTLSEENFQKPDATDRAQMESEASLQLRTRDRERKLLSKIEAALRRIDEGTYGYCEETDEPISLKRLEARPIASLSLDAQERHERMERAHRDD
jgi:DnaK suppressor protein